MFDLPLDDACRPDPVLFENAEWRVLADGLEHRDTAYFIPRDAIGMRRGDLWEWPMHLAEKSWCTPRSFREAFLAALEAFGLAADAGLAQSFAVAFGLVAGPRARRGEAGFVALGDLVRPKPAGSAARKRSPAVEARLAARRIGIAVDPRVGEPARQRVAL